VGVGPHDKLNNSVEMREIISLACNECKRRNYSTTKNKKKSSERLELSKYCRYCRKHTGHKEAK
jgi:large subunit ribosomal protein L33